MNATQAVSGVSNRGGQRCETARQLAISCPAGSSPSNEASGAVTGAREQSSRAVLILTRPEIPTERSFALPTFSGTPEALAAARAGNVKLLDELELFWLNCWRPWSHDGSGESLQDAGSEKLKPMAMEICRACGPQGETLIEWALVNPCGYCWRRQTRRAACRKCGGNGHTSDAWESVYTDLDGRIVELA